MMVHIFFRGPRTCTTVSFWSLNSQINCLGSQTCSSVLTRSLNLQIACLSPQTCSDVSSRSLNLFDYAIFVHKRCKYCKLVNLIYIYRTI
jgi:hypothetical protein